MSPTSRSIQHLREQGYLVQVVERWVPFPKPGHRSDLFGVLDVLAVKPGEILGVQVTAAGVSSRLKKMLASDTTMTLLLAGMKLAVHGWTRKGKRGKRKVYTLREVPITAESFPVKWFTLDRSKIKPIWREGACGTSSGSSGKS